MKELHFYIQGAMILVALALALQTHQESSLWFLLGMLEFALGLYQYSMGWFLLIKLHRKSQRLNIYIASTSIYLLMLTFLDINYSDSMDGSIWKHAWFGMPWAFALYFLIVIEDLLWKRPTHLTQHSSLQPKPPHGTLNEHKTSE